MKYTYLYKTVFLLLFLVSGYSIALSQGIPEKPDPPRLVNDYAGLLSAEEIYSLERKLVAFDDSTSTQIAVVIVNDLAGYEPEEFAQRLGEKWGVGRKGKDNGVVVLVKTKTPDSGGRVFIKPAYGLEGVIPDLACARIIDDDILPAFRNGIYYSGLDKATSTLMSLARGEFTSSQYLKGGGKQIKKASPFAVLVIIIIVFIILVSSGKSNHNNINKKGSTLPLWLLLSMMNSGRGSHTGSWGGFSSGRGGFGGGGFGGFGGGSFGGGGAGGSW